MTLKRLMLGCGLMTFVFVAACRPHLALATDGALLRDDPVLQAMDAELARARVMRMKDYDPPYYVAYAIKDVVRRSVAGKLGAIYLDDEGHGRSAYVDLRVGDYAYDSSEDVEGYWVPDGTYEPATALPLHDDQSGIRHALWLMTDLRYKQALSSYLKLLGQRVYEAEARERPSFSPADPVSQREPRIALSFATQRWRAVVARLGAEIARSPHVFDSEVEVSGAVETRWLVNTEGTRIRTVTPIYGLHVRAHAMAPDGMILDQSFAFYARQESQLPDDAKLVERTRQMLADLEALRKAPILDPYTGPAILEPAATGVFFHEVLGHRLEGHRQDAEEEGKTFASHVGKAILPPFLSLLDDPTLRTHDGTPLNGYYPLDDEGVPSRPVLLVDRGILRSFLMGRRPVKGYKASNGHGRAQGVQAPVARMGNLLVVAHQTIPRAELKARLLAEVRRQGKPFGLLVRDITGGATNTSSYGYQAFKGEARMVYKVDVDTGKETLVRGVEIVGTPLVSLSKVMAASDDTGVFNGYCGAESGDVPVSTIAPATLFREIELQRTARGRSRGPVLEAPPR